MREFSKYIVASVAAMIFALIFYFNSLSLTPAGYQLPRIIITVIILLSIAMFIESYRNYKKPVILNKSEEENNSGEEEPSKINYKRTIIFILMISVYVLSIKPLGYFVITPIYVIAAYLYLKAARLRTILAISIGFTAFVYILFVVLLKLPIPIGPMS
jgi:putative tricarboxylic transport membrane protein